MAIVSEVNSNGTIETISGDWGGEGAGETRFSSTSSVVANAAYPSKDGSSPSVMGGMTISGYISPVGLGANISHEDSNHVMQKNTAANFTPVIAAARFAERLEKSEADFYASWAKTVYQYWRREAVETESDGSLFVRDSIQNGKWQSEYFTYNQGVGIGAALELARLTAKTNPIESAAYLADAHRMADFLVNHETIDVSGLGPVLIDGGGSHPSSGLNSNGDGSVVDAFKGIAYRYLTELYSYDAGLPAGQRSPEYATYKKVLTASYEGILNRARNTNQHEIGFRWDLSVSKQQQRTFVNQGSNVSAVMAVQLFAQTFPSGS